MTKSGLAVTDVVGVAVGIKVGVAVGTVVGTAVGAIVGAVVETLVGLLVGTLVGVDVGLVLVEETGVEVGSGVEVGAVVLLALPFWPELGLLLELSGFFVGVGVRVVLPLLMFFVGVVVTETNGVGLILSWTFLGATSIVAG